MDCKKKVRWESTFFIFDIWEKLILPFFKLNCFILIKSILHIFITHFEETFYTKYFPNKNVPPPPPNEWVLSVKCVRINKRSRFRLKSSHWLWGLGSDFSKYRFSEKWRQEPNCCALKNEWTEDRALFIILL